MKRSTIGREDGVALVTALGVMMVLSIALISIIQFTTSSASHSARSKASQRAYAAAEAGLNDALSQLANLYGSGSPIPGSTSWQSQVASPSGGVSYSGGTATWSSTFTLDASGYGGVWRLEALGATANPTGPGTGAVQRKVVAYVDVYEKMKTVATPDIWNYVYSGSTGSACDMTIDQSTTFTAPLYMPGNLCLSNQGQILKPTKFVAVGGNVDITQTNGSIGESPATKRIDEVYIGGWCRYKNNPQSGPPCGVNDASTQVWATTFGLAPPSAVSPPTIAWDANAPNSVYRRGRPGPADECLKTSDGTVPNFETTWGTTDVSVPGVFNLTPSANYTCIATSGGQLSWDASAKLLTVSGIIFIDGSVEVDTGPGVKARYSGSANIYVSGTVKFQNNSTLCAKLSGSTCDWSGWQPGVSDGMLIFVSNGNGQGQVSAGRSIEVYQSAFQGGLYGTNEVQVEQGSTVQGPMVSPDEIAPGQSSVTQFPSIIKVLVGAPGDSTPPEYIFGAPRFET